jgi:hypothetical protein
MSQENRYQLGEFVFGEDSSYKMHDLSDLELLVAAKVKIDKMIVEEAPR